MGWEERSRMERDREAIYKEIGARPLRSETIVPDRDILLHRRWILCIIADVIYTANVATLLQLRSAGIKVRI